jgi:hypothetical protein
MKKSKQAWMGTIPLFVAILLFTLGILFAFFLISYLQLSLYFPLWISLPLSLIAAFILFAAFLNIPIPRRRKDPTSDLNINDKIAEGAWCSVYMKKSDKNLVSRRGSAPGLTVPGGSRGQGLGETQFFVAFFFKILRF